MPGWSIEYNTDPVSVQHQRLVWRVNGRQDVWNFGQKQPTGYGYLAAGTAYKDMILRRSQ